MSRSGVTHSTATPPTSTTAFASSTSRSSRYSSASRTVCAGKPDRLPVVQWGSQFSCVCAVRTRYTRVMADVTQILAAVEAGDTKAAAELLPLVYDELRKLAAARMTAEAPGQTLQPTALVHEA